MSNQATTTAPQVNNIDLEALQGLVDEINDDSSKALTKFQVTTQWKEQTRSETRVDSIIRGGEIIPRSFTIPVDEPPLFLGTNNAPNPQELLFTALNTCMLVGYVVHASIKGITLEKLELQTEGELDLRGFLGLDESVRSGYETVKYKVTIKGNGTPEQFREIHENVIKTAPNYYNLSSPVKLDDQLVVE